MAISKTGSVNFTQAYAELAVAGGPYAAVSTPSKPWLLSTLNGQTQNPFSLFGPWGLTVNATTKVAEVDYGATNYRLGDWRGYNHDAALPTPPANFVHAWGPGGINTNITLVPIIPEFNVLDANSLADYLRYNAYDSSAKRAASYSPSSPATNRYDTSEEAWLTTATSPPTNHIRTAATRPQSTHVGTFTNFSTSGLGADQVFYFDMYFADGGSDTRLVSLTDTVANGYFEVTLHEKLIPYADSVGTSVSRSGYTGTHVRVNPVASPSVCAALDDDQTFGSAAYSFYVTVVGIASGVYNIGPTSCTCQIIHYDGDGVIRQTKSLGSGISLNSGSNNGVQISSGVYGVLSNTMAYDDYLKFNVTAVSTWGTAYLCT